ncbi:hypothetical protein [Caulobacter endophyticus]|uniref:hypothetical protein n=1 Tax=Caulobacter endophyticus TaxID=2172652 RepID=UPI00240FFC18|nr:hypothetical protein [Caulobacter endophyticus]MDG2531794.1 hypothetical protein [Caulobacter endophyticus]
MSIPPPKASKPENKTLVVALSVLQLTVVALVWLVALVPAALAALAVFLWKGARPTVRGKFPPA